MKDSLRQQLAREPFEEKIRKVGQLLRLAKTFPRHVATRRPVSTSTSGDALPTK